MKTPKKLRDWVIQPGVVLSPADVDFVRAVERAAYDSVGYGFMQQVVEWFWQEHAEAVGLPGAARGPEYYEGRVAALEAALRAARGGGS